MNHYKILFDSFEICNGLGLSLDEFGIVAKKHNGCQKKERYYFRKEEDIRSFVYNYIDPKIVIKVLKNRH